MDLHVWLRKIYPKKNCEKGGLYVTQNVLAIFWFVFAWLLSHRIYRNNYCFSSYAIPGLHRFIKSSTSLFQDSKTKLQFISFPPTFLCLYYETSDPCYQLWNHHRRFYVPLRQHLASLSTLRGWIAVFSSIHIQIYGGYKVQTVCGPQCVLFIQTDSERLLCFYFCHSFWPFCCTNANVYIKEYTAARIRIA